MKWTWSCCSRATSSSLMRRALQVALLGSLHPSNAGGGRRRCVWMEDEPRSLGSWQKAWRTPSCPDAPLSQPPDSSNLSTPPTSRHLQPLDTSDLEFGIAVIARVDRPGASASSTTRCRSWLLHLAPHLHFTLRLVNRCPDSTFTEPVPHSLAFACAT